MNRFNLTFRGEIVEGHDPAQVKTRLAKMLAIDDPNKLQRLFSGDPVVLRRNMERKEAAGLYARLRQQGIHAELVRIGERGDVLSGESAPADTATPTAAAGAANNDPQPPKVVAPEVATGARKIIRRVDLAATKKLRPADSVQLEAREKALKKALMAKQAQEAKRASEREQALAREADRKAKREAARQQAELATAKRVAEQEAARRREEQQRQQAEAAARRQAELERARAREAARQAERERLEAEERARLEAEQQQRLAAEKAERERLEAEDRERLAAERTRQEQARREEQQRVAAEKVARREQKKQQAEQLAAKLQVEQARRKREQAEKAARRKAEELRQRAQEQARLEAEEAERLAQRRAMEEQAIERAAAELAQKPAVRPIESRVRTRLETPSPLHRAEQTPEGGRRKRQPGAPNLYSLRPFRNTPEIRNRAEQSRRITRRAFAGAALAIAILLILAPGLSGLQPPLPENGVRAGAVGPQDRPLLLTGDHLLLHDRSGVGVAAMGADSLGLAAVAAPLAFDAAGELLLTGRPVAAADDAQPQLLRCLLAESRCKPLQEVPAGTEISALVVNPVDGSLLVADSQAGQLLKLSPQGAVLARADASIPAAPVLRLDSGLLLMNSAEGPGISVFRYEDKAFGRQLDEILLLPPAEDAARITGVRDFLRSGEYWWALLDTAGSERAGLYRFDSRWQFVDRPPLTADTRPAGLLNWAGRILALDPARIAVQRFSADGMVEAPLVSSVLTELVAGLERRVKLFRLGSGIGLTLCVFGAIAALLSGSLHRVRSLVYSSCRERGAEPIDKLADAIDWLELAPDRATILARTAICYALLATGLLLAAIGLGVSSLQLSALLLALAGPATALILLQRSEPGHIGIHERGLLLVDHQGMYHMGSGARIHWRGPFLMIDDVIVFSGTPQLPAFSPAELAQRVAPLAAQGVKVDRKIVTVRLLQGRHPLALGALAIVATLAAALALVSLQGIF